jgi:hypothetical protein
LAAGLSGSGITATFANSGEDTFGCYLGPPTVFCYGLNNAGQLGVGGVGGSSGTPTSVIGEPAPPGVSPSRVIKRPAVHRKPGR